MEYKAKFELKDLLPVALIFVVTGIGIAFGLSVMADVQSDFTTNSEEYNATGQAINSVSNISGKLPLIATVVVAAILIGILIRYLMVRFG